MTMDSMQPKPEIDIDSLILIVVGMDLHAEAVDRPMAYHLQDTILHWMEQHAHGGPHPIPIVCTDAWYLNHEALHTRPVICIGRSEENHLAGFLQQRLTTALSVNQRLWVQLDVEFTDLRVCVGGVDHQQTSAALELFERKYLADFLNAVVAAH